LKKKNGKKGKKGGKGSPTRLLRSFAKEKESERESKGKEEERGGGGGALPDFLEPNGGVKKKEKDAPRAGRMGKKDVECHGVMHLVTPLGGGGEGKAKEGVPAQKGKRKNLLPAENPGGGRW